MGSPIGLWTSVSGGMAQSQKLDTVANNLANANTAGFKRDETVFQQYLTAIEDPKALSIDIPRTAFKDSDFYHFDGREHVMVTTDGLSTDHTQGALRPTQAPFDFAINGPAMFTVRTPAGTLFTRSGNFKVDGAGTLVTNEGYPVLGLADTAGDAAADGTAPQGPNPFTTQKVGPNGAAESPLVTINLQDALLPNSQFHVSEKGEISINGQVTARLALAEFPNSKLLRKVTNGTYANPVAANVPMAARASRVHQGMLESSNVNAVSEIVQMIQANRNFESNMKAIKSYNDMATKEANEVGKL